MTKGEIINSVIGRFDRPIRVLEIGRIRAADHAHERGDGWSTLQFARSDNVRLLYSVDNDPETLKVCATFPVLRGDKIVYSTSVKELEEIEPIDLLYLDAENDAEATVVHFRSMENSLSDDAIILIDDVYEGSGEKGDLIVPLLAYEGWMIERMGPMAIAIKGGDG